MSTGVAAWSQTAATNATADSAFNWAEGQAPSSVNDSARALMASVAKWRDDLNGTITTGGTSTAYTATSKPGSTVSATNGFLIAFKLHTNCGASPTLAVDGGTARALVPYHGGTFGAGALKSGAIYTARYDSSNTEWIVTGTQSEFAASTAMSFFQASAPTGWTQNTTYNDAVLRVVSGTGGGAKTNGSALSTLTTGGHSITQAELPNCSFTVTDPGHSHSDTVANIGGGGGVGSFVNGGSAHSTGTATTGISVSSGGSGTAHTHTIGVNYCDMIICSKN